MTGSKSPDDWKDIVRLMIEDCGHILAFTRGLDAESFVANQAAVYAVCYAFVRLGEGASEVPEDIRKRHPEVPWRTVRHYRNFMVHVYRQVDAKRVFKTVREDVAPLQASLEAMQRAYQP